MVSVRNILQLEERMKGNLLKQQVFYRLYGIKLEGVLCYQNKLRKDAL